MSYNPVPNPLGSQPTYSAPGTYTPGSTVDGRAYARVEFFCSVAPTTAYPIQWDDGSGTWPSATATLTSASGVVTYAQTAVPIGFTGRVTLAGGLYVRLANTGAGATFTSFEGQ